MTQHRSFAYSDRLPVAFADPIQEFISMMHGNFVVTLANPTTLQVVAGTDNLQVAIGINGRWRYNTATVTAAHPGGSAGSYDVYVTASDNVFTPTGAPPGSPPETDSTVYTFALAIRATGSPPTTALYRKIGTCTWSGSAITDFAISVGSSRHHQTHEPGGTDPINPALFAVVQNTQGTLAGRPSATAANQGYSYYATDAFGGTLYVNFTGSAWTQVAAGPVTTATTILLNGVFSARPTAATTNSGYLYFATDTGVIYQSTGSAWITWSASSISIAGAILLMGTLGSRPTAAGGNANFFYLATDQAGGTLYQSTGTTWLQAAASVGVPIGTQVAAYTLALTDAGRLVEMNVGTANALTVPPNSAVAFPVGTIITIGQLGAGLTTITAGAGVTLRAYGGNLKLAGQYAMCTLIKRATDEWWVAGNLTP